MKYFELTRALKTLHEEKAERKNPTFKAGCCRQELGVGVFGRVK